jgi:acetyltransferase-like isoleucine patch superfamily enzyme
MIQGDDVRIDPLAVIKRPDLVVLGNHVSIDCFTYISTKITVKDWAHIAPFVSIIGGVYSEFTMGNFTVIAAGGRVICATDDWKSFMICSFVPMKHKNIIAKPIVMEDFTGVATNAVVMPGVTMAVGSVVAANSLLMKDTKLWGIYIGSPARLVGYRNKDGILASAKEMGYDLW